MTTPLITKTKLGGLMAVAGGITGGFIAYRKLQNQPTGKALLLGSLFVVVGLAAGLVAGNTITKFYE